MGWDGMGFGEEGGAVGLSLFGLRPVGAADDGWVWWNGRNSGVERRAGLGLLMGLALKRYGLVGWVVRSEIALGGELFAKEEPIRGVFSGGSGGKEHRFTLESSIPQVSIGLKSPIQC